jgi:antitoxin CptB
MSIGRLRWQCRRGMKELDALMLRYLDDHYLTAPDEDKQAFEDILAMSDPELVGYFLKGETPASEPLQRVVRRILD